MSFSSTNGPSIPMVPNCINQAIGFLARPLILGLSTTQVDGVRAILRVTLGSCFKPEEDGPLTLSFSTTRLPPRPILVACIATGVYWVEWMNLLGKRDFDLFIEPRSVSVTYFGVSPHTVVVWTEPIVISPRHSLLTRLKVGEPQVPVSKLGQQSALQASLRTTVDSVRVRGQTRTIAQQLLESDHEEEADEIFAMISRTAILSPSPTRKKFNFTMELPTSTMSICTNLTWPLSPAEACALPDSSRPSSRSSSSSDNCFSSDDDESTTSASSVNSFDFLDSTKPTPKALMMAPLNRQPSTFVQTPQQAAPRVFVDNNKKEVTKYLYQGGVSTVLTGGVMLGASAPVAAQRKADQVPKYRAPIGGKRFAPAQRAPSANSWRRSPRV